MKLPLFCFLFLCALFCLHAPAAVLYVDLNNASPAAPFAGWATAATNIQDAVDVAGAGDLILVTNGIYQVGARSLDGSTTNRVSVTKPLTLRGVNGLAATVIDGGGAVRCLYLTNGVSIEGFTLTNGTVAANGGGVFSESTNSILSGCLVAGCSAYGGGGVYQATLTNCVLSGNSAGTGGGAAGCILSHCTLANNYAGYGGGRGGGADSSILDDCVLTNNYGGGYGGGGASSSVLNRCTVAGNYGGSSGGGALDCTLNHCDISQNGAAEGGGGMSGGTANNCTVSGNNSGGASGCMLNNCAVIGNSGYAGGGAYFCSLNHCTLTLNVADTSGGGADSCTLSNCIVYYNSAPDGANYSGSTFYFSCTTPLPDGGSGNSADAPGLADAFHLSSTSPCIGAGSTNFLTGTDIDSEPWMIPPSIGCDEFYATATTGGLSVSVSADYTNVAANFTVTISGNIIGRASSNVWDFGDGSQAVNQLSVSHSWPVAGDYPVVLTAYNDSNPGGVSATVMVQVVEGIYYVDLGNANPASPFTSWVTAATTIRDAVDAAIVGGTVLVSNGVYNVGGQVVYGPLTNRVAVTKPLTIQSFNGPLLTVIQGFQTNNDSAVRCVYLTNGAALVGFTLTNGSSRNDGDWIQEYSGGGVWCESTSARVSNCIFLNNTANGLGGGAYGGTLENCTLENNAAGSSGGAVYASSLFTCTLTNNTAIYGGGACSSALTNCTLTGNSTHDDSDHTSNGGGASGCTLANCVMTRNSSNNGGGASGCTLVNCALVGNLSDGFYFAGGGGASSSTLVNCTVVDNTCINAGGGGVISCALTNCIVYFNHASSATNYSDDTLLYFCDTSPLPANGTNNIADDPLMADLLHISSASPCRGAGMFSATSSADIDGNAWLNPPSMGADEFNAGSATGALAVAFSESFTNIAAGFAVNFTALVSGHATANRWNFGDGTIVSNELFVAHNWSVAGNYTVTLTAFNTDNPGGVTTSDTIFVLQNPVHYVALDNATPAVPFLTWATAATNIQEAVDAAFAGGTLIVSNGIYQTGSRELYGMMTNRVAVTKPLVLQSVSGAAATIIDGGNALRCLYLTNHVSVTGFTLRNGKEINGAGVFCQGSDSILSDCVLTGNFSPADGSFGGGANGGTFYRSTFAGNQASYYGSGAANATLVSCLLSNNLSTAYGGGAAASTLSNCVVIGNTAAWGGGVEYCTVNNSLLIGNTAQNGGGGAIFSVTLNNCTVVSNTSPGGAGIDYGTTANNCILYFNNGNNFGGPVAVNYCCTTPNAGGEVNFTNAPLFVNLAGGDFRLQSNSPCINSGNNTYVVGPNDLDGLNRITGDTVDLGAYEYQTPSSILSYAWAQQFGLPTDGSADGADPDGDGMKNWEESRARTNPTNSLSVLQMLSPVVATNSSGVSVTWQSIAGVTYFLDRSPSLSTPPSFSTIQDNIIGQTDTTTWFDETATNGDPFFYRVGVR